MTSTNYAHTGFLPAFEDAGFTEVCRRSETRPIMRYESRRPGRPLKNSLRPSAREQFSKGTSLREGTLLDRGIGMPAAARRVQGTALQRPLRIWDGR